jgi:hypothetical protein
MTSPISREFCAELERQWGPLTKLPRSNSLFEIGGRVRLYVRYSKVHRNSSAFFGLRQVDLMQLEGFASFICFLWDGQTEPLIVPYDDFSDVFATVDPASDGQYKVQVELREGSTELRIVRAGRFGVEGYLGMSRLAAALEREGAIETLPTLSHSQVQSLLGAIGSRSGYAVWTPLADRHSLDFALTGEFALIDALPEIGGRTLRTVMQQIDVLWLERRRNSISAAFEVEFSTPIYSALLRFNDVYIDFKLPRAGVVAHEERRSVFAKQVNRRTFQASGLSEICAFYEYADVYKWFARLYPDRVERGDQESQFSPNGGQPC